RHAYLRQADWLHRHAVVAHRGGRGGRLWAGRPDQRCCTGVADCPLRSGSGRHAGQFHCLHGGHHLGVCRGFAPSCLGRPGVGGHATGGGGRSGMVAMKTRSGKQLVQSTTAAAGGRSLRQTMSDLHIWTGLLAGWVLYAMFLTGTVSYFRDEISQWMRPIVPAQSELADALALAPRLISTMQTLAPASPQWGITLPDARDNTASAFWRDGRRFKSATFDPATAQPIDAGESIGGEFFYRFHFQLHYLPALWGRWLAGLCA